MTKEEFLERLKNDEEYSPGWQAIDDAFEELYPKQEPKHFGTLMTSRAIFGGNEYIDGYSIYESTKDEDEKGEIVTFPKDIDVNELLKVISATTNSVFEPGKNYRDYSFGELRELQKK